MKKTNFVLPVLGIMFFVACNNNNSTSTNAEADSLGPPPPPESVVDTTVPVDFSFNKTLDAGTVSFVVSSPNTPDNSVSIEPSGIELKDRITEKVDGDVKDAFITDLNGDGFPEVFYTVFTQEKEMQLHGYGSNKNKSLSMIYIPDISSSSKMGEGHMIGDDYKVEGNKLIRTFPIYKKDDSMSNPTGGTRTITYKLEAGESGWILEATDFKDSK